MAQPKQGVDVSVRLNTIDIDLDRSNHYELVLANI